MKIYIDVSETVSNKMNTGIQRVVREVVSYSDTIGKKLGLEVIPVVSNGKYFYRLNNLDPLLNLSPPHTQSADVGLPKAKSLVVRIAKRIVKLAPFAYHFIVKLKVASTQSKQFHLICSKKPINVGAEDVLLLLDSFWSGGSTIDAAFRFRQSGGTVLTIIYDITPFTHSEHCDVITIARFTKAFPLVVSISDGIIAISNAVADELRGVIAPIDKVSLAKLPIDYFHLGADFSQKGVSEVLHDDYWPKGLWGNSTVFVMVGTIEPRKGHAFVLDVFEQRWQQGKPEKLLIVGKVGWKTEALVERIASSPYYGTQLFMVNQVSDSALQEAYQKAYACVMASYAEGFGLPVIESLQYGVPVIASDIPVFREIAGNFAEFFTLDDVASFDNAIDALQENYKTAKQKLESFKWLTWQASTEQLLSKVKEMALKLAQQSS